MQPISPVFESISSADNFLESKKRHAQRNSKSSPFDHHHRQPCMTDFKKMETAASGILKTYGRISDTQKNNLCKQRDSPDKYIWRRLESLVECMFSETQEIVIRNVKSLMSTIPSVFSGSDLILWFMRQVGADDITEAVNLATRISSLGYFFSIDDHSLTVKNDSHTYYRFQTPCLYPSRCPEADTVDYAVYLCKRTMQNKHRLELADFEAERLASLQNLYYHKWEFIYMQAEAEVKVDKKRDKFERIVLESQEAAYWDVHRPPPGCVNTTEVDMRKLCRAKRPKKLPLRSVGFPIPSGPENYLVMSVLDGLPLVDKITKLKMSMRKRIKASKAIENLQNYCDQYAEFDSFLHTCVIGIGAGSIGMSIGAGVTPGSINSAGLPLQCNTLPLNSRKTSAAILSTHAAAVNLATCMTASDKSNETGSIQDSIGQNNPWISDNADYWNSSLAHQDLSIKRVKRWSFSFQELLKDPIGRCKFQQWLEKEFAVENLMFWQECQDLKSAPLRELPKRIKGIYSQYLSINASEPINVDSKVREVVLGRLGLNERNESELLASVGAGATHLDRYSFEEAEEQIFQLMKSDSYCRFLRSDVYRELFANTKKKSKRYKVPINSGTSVVGFGAE